MTAGPGITFREVMRGTLMPRGAGQPGGTLALHATATIPDVARFVADAGHGGVLGGAIAFDPFGPPRPISGGTFQLFVPTDDPDLKLMVYRATFEHGGATWCLDGAKQVRRRSILRSWTDTTTLYCRLHAGPDPAAPVVAAGALRLGPLAFAGQLFTFRTVQAATVAGKARALAGFFGFFSRELIDTYLWRRHRRPGPGVVDGRS
jgi:hypothetical protein